MKEFTAEDVLRKVNKRGLVGYAHGGDDNHLPAIREAEARGWIAFSHDDTPKFGSRDEGQRRDIFSITAAGRVALEEIEKSDAEEVMRAVDRMPAAWRALAHEFGAKLVTQMHADNPRGLAAARADLEAKRERDQAMYAKPFRRVEQSGSSLGS